MEGTAIKQNNTTPPATQLQSLAGGLGGSQGSWGHGRVLLAWLCGSQRVLGRALLPLPWLPLCLGTGSGWRRVLAATIHWCPGRFGRNFPTLVKAVLVPLELLLCPLLLLLSVLVSSWRS